MAYDSYIVLLQKRKKFYTALLHSFLTLIALGIIFFAATPTGRTYWNNWFYKIKKIDEATNYNIKKKVEDTCRAMMSSYESDKLTYEMYKNGEGEKKSWAEQAKMRANKTAASYNEYILKNSYVWEDNVPADIKEVLPYLE